MRAALLLLSLALPLQDGGPVEENAFIEVVAPREVFFVHEAVRLRLRVGFDPRFFRTRAIQLFPQELDVPVQVEAPWLPAPPGTLPLPAAPAEAGGEGGRRSLALNDGVIRARPAADQVVAGRRYAVLEIDRPFLPERPGVLAIPAPRLRFAFATAFHEDPLSGRVAMDRREVVIYGDPLLLRIDPLPEEGRPPAFGGAVGRFAVQAEADRRELRVGESLRLRLVIAGEGNLDRLEPPRLDGLAGLHAYGRIEERSENRRTVTYDLVPLRADVREVPPIPFAFFEPGAGYRTVRTAAIPLVVRPLPAGASLRLLPGEEGRRAVPGVNDLFGLKAVPAAGAPARGLPPGLLLAGLLGPWLLAFGVQAGRRARDRARADLAGRRARGAAAAFLARTAAAADPAAALADYLAARLGCPAPAVVAPDLAARLEAAGLPAALAGRAARLLWSLVAARYGGDALPGGAGEARAVVAELEAAFQARERGR